MVGQRGAITADFNVDDKTEADTRSAIEVDIFKVIDGGLQALTSLTPDDDAYALPEYPRASNTYWDDADAAGGVAPEDVGADTEPESSGDLTDAAEELSADGGDVDDGDEGDTTAGNEDTEEVVYDDLNDDAQQFVDDAVSAMEAKDMATITELDDFEERVATYDGTVNVTADVLADIIDGEANV